MKPLRMFAWLLAAACAVYAASNLLFVYRYWWPEPFSGQRHWIDALYRGGAWSAFTLAVNVRARLGANRYCKIGPVQP